MDEYSTLRFPFHNGSGFGNYSIETEISSHPPLALTHVYRALDTQSNQVVALKIFSLNSHPAFDKHQARFLREIYIMQKVHHPHILPIILDGHNAQFLWLVMPYCHMGTLAGLMEQRNYTPLPVSQACDYAIQMCQALYAAHMKWPPIIHRDVKPQNMLFDDDMHLLLTDFGNAHILFDQHLTEQNYVIGTPRYMAPEQFLLHNSTTEHTDPRLDIYALGCVLYEMLSGAPLYANIAKDAPMQTHVHDTLRPLNELNAHVSAGLALIVSWAMNENPNRRFRTAALFAQALEPFVRTNRRS